MAAPTREKGGRAPPRGRWARPVIFVVLVLVLVAAGILMFTAFLGPHLIGSAD